MVAMNEGVRVQGRLLEGPQLEHLRQWVGEHRDWSRWRLSRDLAARWDWRNGAGQLKDMAVRTLLNKLHERRLIELPPRRRVPTRRMGRSAPGVSFPQAEAVPVAGALTELGTLRIHEVSGQAGERAWVRAALSRFHYLGFGGTVGENLLYVIDDGQERRLACLAFGAGAWQCQDRDRFIGWSAEQRQRNLSLVANNSRFLILPWVQVPELGSWILGQVGRRIAADWQAKYGHALVLLETFVEPQRFAGTVYQAANWQWVGATTGRSRQDRYGRLSLPRKDIYVQVLQCGFQEALRA